jgi:succinate dehydrogenase / fumarate reductase, cytochrome b subunit
VTTFAAKTIRWGGVLLLAFIVFHILHMTLGQVAAPGFVHLDPYNNVRQGLANPLVAGFYVLAIIALGCTCTTARGRCFARLASRAPRPPRSSAACRWCWPPRSCWALPAIPIGALVGAFPDAPSPVMAEGH